MPISRRSRSSSARICAWIVTSSAVVGSSAISSDGSQASASAIITRWRMPPDSWCGYSSRRCARGRESRPAPASRSARVSAAARSMPRCMPQRFGDLLADA